MTITQSYVEWTGDQITLLETAQKKKMVMVTHARQQSSTNHIILRES